MKKIEPGLLCLIIKNSHPENLGKCVTVVRYVYKGDELPEIEGLSPDENGWLAEGQDLVSFVRLRLNNKIINEEKIYTEYGVFSSDQLLPIDGEDKLTINENSGKEIFVDKIIKQLDEVLHGGRVN